MRALEKWQGVEHNVAAALRSPGPRWVNMARGHPSWVWVRRVWRRPDRCRGRRV